MDSKEQDGTMPSERPQRRLQTPSRSAIVQFMALWLCVYVALTSAEHMLSLLRAPSMREAGRAVPPAGPDFSSLREHCASAQPIGADEFIARQRALGETLRSLGGAAYIAEPGPNAQFFANLSASAWHTSERPFLLIVTPGSASGEERVTVLTPAFEETRARLLTIPARDNVHFTAWAEEADPYAIALAALKDASPELDHGTIFVDEAARFFVADRLRTTAAPELEVRIAPPEVRALRERKSPAELALMTCANEVTVLAIRAVRDAMYIGITASQTSEWVHRALTEAGLTGASAIVLFGEDAARPHGGGEDRVLGKNDLVLIDTGGKLHNYESDITRTFALPDSEIHPEHLAIWYTVQAAQAVAGGAAMAGVQAGDVDAAARTLIDVLGYGEYFTHRLGHGIGLETHEDPYLRGNNNVTLAVGNTFSDEPGIYIDGKVGVRLEDIFVIGEDGSAHFLTEAVGGRARSPWNP